MKAAFVKEWEAAHIERAYVPGVVHIALYKFQRVQRAYSVKSSAQFLISLSWRQSILNVSAVFFQKLSLPVEAQCWVSSKLAPSDPTSSSFHARVPPPFSVGWT